VQIIRIGGPEVIDAIDVPEPGAGPGEKVHDVSTVGVNHPTGQFAAGRVRVTSGGTPLDR
jgi:hypothetical protein